MHLDCPVLTVSPHGVRMKNFAISTTPIEAEYPGIGVFAVLLP